MSIPAEIKHVTAVIEKKMCYPNHQGFLILASERMKQPPLRQVLILPDCGEIFLSDRATLA